MNRQRIALIFDDLLRPETTGIYCLRALKQLHDVQHFRPDQLQQISRHAFDLYLNVDDGLRYRLPAHLRPCAWWVIDTHLDPLWAEQKGGDFDWVFTAQRNGAERLQKAGISAQWLPLACDPQMHRRFAVENQWDICFIGHVVTSQRSELLTLIQQQFPRTFVGERYFEEFARTYSAAKIGLNCSVKDDINMRVFETLACGPLLVTNDLQENGQDELFTTDKHLITYRSRDELVDKLLFYLSHCDARNCIADAGHAEALARHTYLHRMQSLLEATQHPSRQIQTATSIAASKSESYRPRQFQGEDNVQNSFSLESIDFIIKTFLRPQALLRLLKSLDRYYPDSHVSVADDGDLRESTDVHSRACCSLIDAKPQWRLHTMPAAAGVTAGRNLLVDRTTRPLLLLLDDDFCFTDQTRIEQLTAWLESDPLIGVVAGSCVDVIHGERRPRNSGGTLELNGETLAITSGAWRDQAASQREYVPQFALVRREVFSDVRWDGGIGAEHYDFLLQLKNSRWKVVQDLSVQIDHYPLTESLPGYAEHRFNYQDNQQWLLRKWGLRRIVQDGKTIVERSDPNESMPPHEHNATVDRPLKDSPYFEFARPEVAALVPTHSRRVLDVGCGAGRLGALLKQRQTVHVTGLEMNPTAAAKARLSLDRVLAVNVEDSNTGFPAGTFDCIICADVLEHLRDPATVLSRIRHWLEDGGVLVISLPNTRHYSIVAGLLEGNWTYESAGLLDNDHVRFFTRREIEKLLFRAGFNIEVLVPVPGTGHREWVQSGRPGAVKVGALQVEGLDSSEAEEFFTYQYLVLAKKAPVDTVRALPAPARPAGSGPFLETPFALTSIIIVTFNQIGYTRECVESIRMRTDEPYELIFVDNGSTDGTPEYLNTLSGAKVICNPDNRGFPAAVNQGLKLARGEQILLLNNDTVVSTGWLRSMLSVFARDSGVGLVGPCSNNISGSQMIPAAYGTLASMDGFAWDWCKRHARQTSTTDRLVGFCLMIRKEVIEQIGGLDERFGVGCYEDDDFCRRAIQRGWKVVIARDSFVHHYGSRTFAASGIDFASLMHTNQMKFDEKWKDGSSSPVKPGRRFSFSIAEGGGLLLAPTQQPRLSLCMIVRNNETTIGPCLESIRPWVDEMIVVDTGSTDATPDICRELGAVVHHWSWRDDFSAARNESLQYATGEWIFWMDSDDTISEECGGRLRALADADHSRETMGYVVQVHCPGAAGDKHDVTAVDHVKLIRNRPDLRFEHRIHEQILPAIRRAGGDVEFTDIYVVHSGADHTPDGRARKLKRDFKLLHLDLQERPDHPFVLFNLGMTHADVEQFDEAVHWLNRCLEVSRPDESHVRKTYALLVSSLMQLRDYHHAATVCRKARGIYPDDKELQFRQAMLAHQLGDFEEAAKLYRSVLMPTGNRHFMSIDLGLSGFKARHNLALVFEDQRRFDLAESEWRTILIDQPSYVPARVGLIECLIRRRADQEAETNVAMLQKHTPAVPDSFRMAARLAESRGELETAKRHLERGLQECGDEAGLLRELARLLHDSRDHLLALPVLDRLIVLKQDDASGWHNRGVILGLLERTEESQMAFSRAAALRSSQTSN